MTILTRVNRANATLVLENARLKHEIKILVADALKWRDEASKLYGENARLRMELKTIRETKGVDHDSRSD